MLLESCVLSLNLGDSDEGGFLEGEGGFVWEGGVVDMQTRPDKAPPSGFL